TLLSVSCVGVARFELATSCSQSRRDNRATLHPERVIFIYFNFLFLPPSRLPLSLLRPSRLLSGRDNRATLHPQRLSFISTFYFFHFPDSHFHSFDLPDSCRDTITGLRYTPNPEGLQR